MNCVECRVLAKYKCPVCRQPYCSIDCCKKHKLKPCTAPPPPQETQQPQEATKEYEFPTEDTVPPEKLQLLEKSLELKKCLENPYVREILLSLDKCSHPDELIQEYMQEPIFTEFVDACLKVVQPQEDVKD